MKRGDRIRSKRWHDNRATVTSVSRDGIRVRHSDPDFPYTATLGNPDEWEVVPDDPTLFSATPREEEPS